MKKILQFFMILMFTFLFTQLTLSAKNVSGSLSAGEGSSFVPMQGSAFSIIRDVKSGVYDSKFNIVIQSGGSVIYDEKNQLDDLYLVFNDAVDDGDIIKLDVVKGLFLFKMNKIDKLPEAIVDAIKEQAPEEYSRMKKNQKSTPAKKTVVKDASRVIKRHVEPVDDTPQAPVINEPDFPVMEPKKEETKNEPGFFDNLSSKLGTLVGSDETPQKVSTLKPIPQNIGKLSSDEKVSTPVTTQSGIGKLPNAIENINKERTSIMTTQDRAINSNTIQSGIDTIAQEQPVRSLKNASSGIKSLPVAKTFPMDAERLKTQNGLSKRQTEIDTFSKTATPTIRENQSNRFQTDITSKPQVKPTFQTKVLQPQPTPEPQLEEVLSVPAQTQPEIVKDIVPKVQAPTIVKAPYVKKEESKDRIVITKTLAGEKKKENSRVVKRHIEPEDYKAQQEQAPARMSDRIAGNGYGMATQGRLKVKAFSNNRAVSAWVEVFQAGTNKRVKTFYTGKGGSLKDIKLPAGTYIIKATYRTANLKRKKTLGRVVLEEGGSINKSISFNDGSVTVTVKKSGEPLYAKVEVYKSGSKRRVAYEFTSRSTGVAKLSLGSGKYDIVIKDHNNIRRFDDISIRGGKSKTINADF